MAYTENEIYYPYDYDASADVPEDMKTMAESIDEVVGEIKGTQTTQNTRLSALETGQTSQSASIQALQSENTRLKKNQIYGTSTGTEVEITDGAEMGASIGVSGESTQETRSGKNILDANNPTGTNLATVGFNNNILTVSSTVTNTTPFARYEFPISYGDIVRLNAIILDTNGQIVTQVYNGTTWVSVGALIKNYIDGSSISPITYESTEGYTAIRFLFYSNKEVPTAETSARYKNVIVTKNDSDMAYEPYGAMPSPEYPSEIKNLTGNTVCTVRGKNLWNSELEIAEYDVNGNKTTTLVWLVNQVPINVKPNTQYTISQAEKPSQYRIICFKDYNYLSRINNTQNTSSGYVSYTFTTPANCNKIFIQFRSTLEVIATGSYDMSTTSITEVQLEKGTKTDYEPNQETSVTFPFGAQKLAKDDYLASDGIHHLRSQTSLPNITTLSEGTILGTSGKFATYTLPSAKNVTRSYDFLSNKIASANETFGKYKGYRNSRYLYVMTDTDDTVENFNSKISGSIVEYELETEVVTQYTQAQQTAYNNLQNLILFEGYNHIEMTSPNGVKANLTVNYTKNTGIVIQNLDERIQALENAILEV